MAHSASPRPTEQNDLGLRRGRIRCRSWVTTADRDASFFATRWKWPHTRLCRKKGFAGDRTAGCWGAREEWGLLGGGKSFSVLDGAACVLQRMSNSAWKPSGRWQELNNLQSSLNWYILSLIRTCSSRDSVLRFRGVVKTSFLECWSYLSSIRTASSFKIRYLPYYISTLLVSELSTFGCKTVC